MEFGCVLPGPAVSQHHAAAVSLSDRDWGRYNEAKTSVETAAKRVYQNAEWIRGPSFIGVVDRAVHRCSQFGWRRGGEGWHDPEPAGVMIYRYRHDLVAPI